MESFLKKLIVVFYLCTLPFVYVYPQTGVESDCNSNLENVFKVHTLKIRYETVKYIYEKHGFLYVMSKAKCNEYFELIRGFPMDFNSEKQKDTIISVNSEGEKLVNVKFILEEEMNRYIRQLNCTPEKAFNEYQNFIQTIKSEKKKYLMCIDAEIAKGDLSEYASDQIIPLYSFFPPGCSLTPPPISLTKLDFLKVFKEFIFNYNEEALPDGMRVSAYLKCNCKIP